MCTLIALHRVVPGAALVVAANRDECFARPSEPPTLRASAAGEILAPLDASAGGTWLGVNTAGLFVGLTNVGGRAPDPARRSRGLLVVDALACRSAQQAAEKIQGLPLGAYNPFNLIVADVERAFAFTYAEGVRAVPVRDGTFVIGNAPLDAEEPPKLARLRERVARAARYEAPAALDALAGVCRDHEPGPRGALDAVCVHTASYGTRSSCLLSLSEAGPREGSSAFRFADGPPCQTAYEELTPLLRSLGRTRPGGAPSERTT
jgi:uncharacterized protein with NRDE domain